MSCTDTGLVLGKNAILQLYKAGEYRDFAIATDITVDFKTETKSVKTIGDGVWSRVRPQSIGYTISLSGLIKVGEYDDPMAFDVLAYQTNFVDLQYRVIFEEGVKMKVIQGFAIVESSSFSGPSDGFATGTFNMTGNGEPYIMDGLIPCDITISSVTVGTESSGSRTVTMNTTGTGTLHLIEYTIDGGERQSYFGGTSFSISRPAGTWKSYWTYEFIPVCPNGYDGVSKTINISFSQASATCSLVISSVTVGSESAGLIPVTMNITGTGSLERIDYSVNGGARQSVYGATTFNLSRPSGTHYSSYNYVFYPVCTNGDDGTSKAVTITFSDVSSSCALTIDDIEVGASVSSGIVPVTLSISGSGSLDRIEYSINGGVRQSVYGQTTFNINKPTSPSDPTWTYVFYPICSNGQEGVARAVSIDYNSGNYNP